MSDSRVKKPLHVGRALVVGAIAGIAVLVIQFFVSGFDVLSTLILLGALVVVLGGAWLILRAVNKDRVP